MRAELFVLVILVLIALISFLGVTFEMNKKFGIEVPAFGGTLREGIIGNPRFINPLLAQSDADRDAVSLIYAGLLGYRGNGDIIPVLAEKYEISEDGLRYVVTLKDKIYWSDGKKLTADDIVFTVQLAKNPLAQSPKRANWEGVEVEQIDPKTVAFYLKRAYIPFLENLTSGILPKHLWENIPPQQIALASLNTAPIGAGPYKISSVSQDSNGTIDVIKTKANPYFVLGKPHIQNVVLNFYPDEDQALRDFKNGVIDSMGAVAPKNIASIKNENVAVNTISIKRIIAVFLNQNLQKSLASLEIRNALNLATDKRAIIDKVLLGYGKIADGPLPHANAESAYDKDLAKSMLEKQKQPVMFTITTVKTSELLETAEILKEMWNSVGVKTEIQTFPVSDLEQSVIGPRRYDAFLYGEEVVGKNPDPFAFWHSSQRSHPGYNIALYANTKVDKLLETVRTEQDEEKRGKLYDDIHASIKKDLPAIFLFSPEYIYLLPKKIGGADIQTINTGSDRFSTIHNWYLKRNYVWKIFLK